MNVSRFIPIALVLTACASQPDVPAAPAPPPQPDVVALTPTGTYEYITSVQGQVVTGTMTITGAPGAYGGRVVSSSFPEIGITAVTHEAMNMTVHGNLNGGAIVLKLEFDGAKFEGTWELGADGGAISGKKTSP